MTCMVFDWDGTLHEHPGWVPEFGAVDLTLIREAHALGYSVAVSTCNDVGRVAAALRAAGLDVYPDFVCKLGSCGWTGGKTGRQVLVTNRKVSGWVVDDRAFGYRYGDDTGRLWARIERAEARHAPLEEL